MSLVTKIIRKLTRNIASMIPIVRGESVIIMHRIKLYDQKNFQDALLSPDLVAAVTFITNL